MDESAHNKSQTILLTDVGSPLGASLSVALLSKGHTVFGSGTTHPPEEILQNPNFTLIDIDLSQPIPNYLPDFDLLVHLSSEKVESSLNLSSTTRNILKMGQNGQSHVALCLPITSSVDFVDFYGEDRQNNKHLKVFLVGDIYGPNMPFAPLPKTLSIYTQNRLTDIIFQAIYEDKIILPNDGQDNVYPTYVDDATHAIVKFLDHPSSKQIRFIVSQNPTTTLSASYQIQNAASIILKKELGIYFSGPPSTPKVDVEPVVKVPDLGFSPKFDLAEGIRQIFATFSKDLSNNKKHQSSLPHQKSKQLEIPKALKDSLADNDESSKSGTLRKKPRFNLKFKKFFLVFVLAIILFSAKFAYDTYFAISDIKSSKENLLNADFELSRNKADQAQKHFASAKGEFNALTLPVSIVFPQKVNSFSYALKSGESASGALENFAIGAKALSSNLSGVVSPGANSQPLNLEEVQAAFSKAHFQASYAEELATLAKDGNVLAGKMTSLLEDLHNLSAASQTSYELANILPELTAAGSEKNYLVLVQNNAELRPGGGFIGNYAVVSFNDGKLISVDVDDIYNIDGQLKEKIDPPLQLTQKLGVKQLYLRDSNWTVDFAINAKTARDFYKKETGRDVDGVIAIDLSFMQNLLAKIGPVKLDDYKEEISDQNLFDKGEYYAEIGFFPGSSQKKDFFASLTRNLIDKITSSLKDNKDSQDSLSPLIALVGTAAEGLSQKHLLVSLDSKTAQTFLKSKGWDNPLPPANYEPADDSVQTRDFLAISEANIGANKVNRYLEREVDYQMTIGRDADLVANLTITYKNNSPNDSWPAGTYVNYLRVYTPLGSGLEDFRVDNVTDLKKVEVLSQANLTAYATLVEVPVKQTRTVTFKYRIPKNIKLETAPAYSVYFQKQPGTEHDSMKFTFDLPAYLKIDSVNNQPHTGTNQTYSTETDLSVDRLFTIGVVGK